MSAAVGDDGEEQKVVLRVYDLSNGMARTMSQQLLGMQVDIVPHTGVFVYGREWCAAERLQPHAAQPATPCIQPAMRPTRPRFFSGGIQSAPSWGMMPMHEEIVLGVTGALSSSSPSPKPQPVHRMCTACT